MLTFELRLVSDITWLAEWMNVRTFSRFFGGLVVEAKVMLHLEPGKALATSDLDT